MNLTRKLRTLRTMSRSEVMLIAQALLLPEMVGIGFWTLGVAQTQRHLRRWAMAGHNKTIIPAPDRDKLILSARRAHAAARHLPGMGGTCLQRSMTLWALLLRRGVAVDLRVGFRSRDGRIEGHAWIEYQGKPVNESPAKVGTYEISPRPASFDRWPVIE